MADNVTAGKPAEKKAFHVFKVDFADGTHRNIMAEKQGDISFKLGEVTGISNVASDVEHLDNIAARKPPTAPAKAPVPPPPPIGKG